LWYYGCPGGIAPAGAPHSPGRFRAATDTTLGHTFGLPGHSLYTPGTIADVTVIQVGGVWFALDMRG